MNTPQVTRPDLGGAAATRTNFRQIYHTLLERSWLVAICVVVAAFLTAHHIQNAPTIYSATATLQVEQEEQRIVKIEKIQQEDLRSQDILNTIVQNLQTRDILARVILTNRLNQDPRFIGTPPQPPTQEKLISMLAKAVDVRLRRGTRLIDVTVKHTSKELTAVIANSIVKEYIVQNSEARSTDSEAAVKFLAGEAERLQIKLAESEKNLQAYKEKTSFSLDEKQDIITPKLKELSTKVFEANLERRKWEAEYAQIQLSGASNATALASLPVVMNDPAVAENKSALVKNENDFASLQERYKWKHPKYKEALLRLEQTRAAFTNALFAVPNTVRISMETAKVNEEALEKDLAQQETASQELTRQKIGYDQLLREYEGDKAMFVSVLNRQKETSVTQTMKSDKVRIIETAFVPDRPVAPDKQRILTRGLVAGLVGGILLALGIGSLDTSLKTVDEVEEILRFPVLGAVPQVREIKGKGQFVVTEDAKSLAAEAFRTLRTSLSMLGREEARKIFLFTSALPQEGKTFCSLNYSASLSQQGLRTVLIDGDLRRPAVENAILGKRTQRVGVSDFLTGTKKLGEIVQTTELENLFFISAGTTAPNPAELLAQGNFNSLVDEASLNFDRVIIDSAPIHAVSDTLLMLDRIQTVSVVVRAHKTPRKAVARAIHMLLKGKAPISGIILNRLPRRRGRGYYYDPYYDYSYQDKYAEKGVYGA